MSPLSAFAFLQSEVDALASANESTVMATLPEWGSLTILLIILHFETNYDVVLSGPQVRACATVGDLLKLIPSRP